VADRLLDIEQLGAKITVEGVRYLKQLEEKTIR
jgi:hypothetical protein